METKRCSTCKEIKSIDDFSSYFENRGQKRRIESRCKRCESLRNKKWFEANQGYTTSRHRKWAIQNRYGLSLDEYQSMLEKQGGVCAICGELPENKSLAIDHDRSCCDKDGSCGNCVRGLLCSSCNNGLGRFRDNIKFLKNATSYLEEYSGKEKKERGSS